MNFPRNTHYRLQASKLWNFLPLFHGIFGFVFGDVCWYVCDFGSAIHSSRVSSYPFVSAKLGVAFRSIWRDTINVKMVDWPTYLNWALSSLLSCILSQNTVANSQPSQPHAISSAAGASPRAVVKVRVIRAQSTWSLEKVGYNCCNLCSTYPPGNPHIPPLEK